MKFIHISDLHIQEDNLPLYGLDPCFRFELAIKSIEKNHSDAEFVVITDDLTSYGSQGAYEILSKILSKTKLRIYPILGNHDKRDKFLKHFPDFKSGDFIQYSKKIDNTAHIFLDTLVENNSYGELCKQRIEWLKAELDRYRDNFIYLYMHHHPVDSGLYEMDHDANFKSSCEFWSLLKNHNNVKHISFGHLHRIMHTSKQGVSMHSTRGTVFQVAYLPSKKEEYLTNEEKPTYAIVDIAHDGNTRVHHHEFLSEDKLYLGD